MGTISAGGTTPPDAGTNDRRVALRRSVVDSHLITVDLAFQAGALLLDLSETGMGVQALASAPMGTTTPVHFELPETGGRVDGIGRIAWTDSSGRLGIRFEEMAELSRLHLAQWLSRDRRPLVAPGPNVAMPTWPPPHTRDEISALRRDLITEKLEGDAALAFIVERMRNVTRATGAAIALEDGGEIVCRASSGNAPGVGALVDPRAGLSGECMRTGEIVRCEDTETDPRADRLVCRRLELRSIVIVPIRVQGRPAGLLEAFSSRAHAFQSSDVLLLRRVSDLVAGIAARQPESGRLPAAGGPALMAAALLQPIVPEPVAEDPIPLMMDEIFTIDVDDDVAPPTAPAEAAKPQPPASVGRQPEIAPVQRAVVIEQPAPKAKKDAIEPARVAAVAATVAPVKSPTPAAPVSKAEIKPGKIEKPAERSPAPPLPTLAPVEAKAPKAVTAPVTRETVAPVPVVVPPPINSPEFVSPRAMAAAASAAVRVPAEPMRAPVQADVAELPKPAADRVPELPPLAARWSPLRMRITGAAILVAVLVVGGWQVWRVMTPPKGTPMDSEVKPLKPLAPPVVNAAPAPAQSTSPAQPGTPQPALVTAKATNPPAAPAVAKKPAAQKAAEPITVPPPAVERAGAAEPPLTIALNSHPAESAAISNMLRAPVASPTLDMPRVSQMSGGKLIRKVDPGYPSAARGRYGEVVLKATINRDGKVTGVQIVKGDPVLSQSAAAAVRRWRYEPFVLNGFPVEVENTIVVNFKAPAQQ